MATTKAKTKAATKAPATKATATGAKTARAATKKGAAKKAATKATKRFRVLLEKHVTSEATGIVIPFDVPKTFGTRARVPVRGKINGYAFRGSLFPVGDGTHYMVVRRELREAAGVRSGQTIAVTLERDDEPRTVPPPADLARALKRDKHARAAWDKLSYTHRREYAELSEGAKRPETRQRRVEKTISQLLAGKKELFDK
jgi:hypothetical protein